MFLIKTMQKKLVGACKRSKISCQSLLCLLDSLGPVISPGLALPSPMEAHCRGVPSLAARRVNAKEKFYRLQTL